MPKELLEHFICDGAFDDGSPCHQNCYKGVGCEVDPWLAWNDDWSEVDGNFYCPLHSKEN